MGQPITFGIMRLLHDEAIALGSGAIARRLYIDAEKVQKQIPKLLRRGVMTKSRRRGAGYAEYSVNDEQWEIFIGTCRRFDAMMVATQQDDEISRKLKFLRVLEQGVHCENPILREIVGDYMRLRRRQSRTEEFSA